jgi:hypothetical protein
VRVRRLVAFAPELGLFDSGSKTSFFFFFASKLLTILLTGLDMRDKHGQPVECRCWASYWCLPLEWLVCST